MHLLLFLLATLLNITEPPKTTVMLQFDHLWYGQLLIKNKVYQDAQGNNQSFKKLKYYISHVQLKKANGKLQPVPGIYLVDAFGKDSIITQVQAAKYTGVQFVLGVDSAIHVAGVQDGDLDPLNDMYWAWNTGFVNFKMEATANGSTGDQNRLEYHIGGFRKGENTQRLIVLNLDKEVKAGKKKPGLIKINFNAAALTTQKLLVANNPQVMKPGRVAMLIADEVQKAFNEQ